MSTPDTVAQPVAVERAVREPASQDELRRRLETARRARGRPRGRFRHGAAVSLAYLVALAFVFPYLYMVLSAFKRPIDNLVYPPKWAFSPSLSNFRHVIQDVGILSFLKNTVLVATLSTSVAMAFAVPAAYGIARFRMRRREAVAYLFLAMQMVPAISVVFALYGIADRFGLLDTPWILVTGYTLWNIPWGIWLVRGFIEAVPDELEEAAMVDGSSRLGALRRVTIPLAAPGLSAAAILLFIGAWNEFTLAFFLTSTKARTFPTTIGLFLTHAGIEWGNMFATAAIGTVPIVVFALLIRRYFVSSLTFGAVKG